MKNYHLIQVVHHDIEKVKIRSLLHNQTRIIEYNMSNTDMEQAAVKFLKDQGFTPKGRGIAKEGFIYFTSNFDSFKKENKKALMISQAELNKIIAEDNAWFEYRTQNSQQTF